MDRIAALSVLDASKLSKALQVGGILFVLSPLFGEPWFCEKTSCWHLALVVGSDDDGDDFW